MNRLSTATTAEIRETYLAVLAAIDTPNARARAMKAKVATRLLAALLGSDFDPRRDLAAYARDLDALAYPDAQ